MTRSLFAVAATAAAVLLTAAPAPVAGESVLGIYVFHRHGDRTAKARPPTALTALGAEQVYSSGTYFRNRYVASGADNSTRIASVASDVVVLSQISITSPADNVLQGSANFFAQGLYPAAGTVSEQTLANGTVTEMPLNGYQYVPVNAVASAASSGGSEDSAWLQGNSGCGNAVISSNNYFFSQQYLDTLSSTSAFYQDLLPVINSTYTSSQATFKNAYAIYDYIHVSQIHNSSIPSDNLLTDDVLSQTYSRASEHEWGLAYNASESIRAISGAVLAGQVLEALNTTVQAPPAKASGIVRLNFQFGAYATFMSLFGLMDMPAASPLFYGIVDYASSVVFELVTNATVTDASAALDPSDISVRFLLANGSAAAVDGGLTAYPMFGQQNVLLAWPDFVDAMSKIAISDTATWCQVCGNSTGICSAEMLGTASSSGSSGSGAAGTSSTKSGGGGVSKAVAGVIGALVTLAVILGLEALVMAVGDLRVVKKGKAAAPKTGSA